MEDFMRKAADKALSGEIKPNPSVADWATTAFSVIGVLGGHTGVNDEVGELLTELLAQAPNEVVVGGTIKMMVGVQVAQTMLGSEVPDDPSSLTDPQN